MKNFTLAFLALVATTFISCSKHEILPNQNLTYQVEGRRMAHNLRILVDWVFDHGSPSYTIYMGVRTDYCEGWWGICKGNICIPKDDSNPTNQGYFIKDTISDVNTLILPPSALEHSKDNSLVIGSDIGIYNGDTLKAGTYHILYDEEQNAYINFSSLK